MNVLDEAKRVLDIEAQSILDLKDRLDASFEKSVSAVAGVEGKLICAGIGKSGHIARKIASTFSSTGTPAVFLHAAESSHGDLGVITEKDVLLVMSHSGASPELKDLLNFVQRKGVTMIAITSNPESALAKAATYLLNSHVKEEACPLNLAPTSSSTASLALGDALAMAVLKQKGFREEDFAEFHPGGSLGRRLLTRVKDLMHDVSNVPLVSLDSSMKDVLPLMTSATVRGVLGVTDSDKKLVGVITDGDLRRHLNDNKDPLSSSAKELMSNAPKTILESEMAAKALFVMEQFSIQMLFVMSEKEELSGLIHLQDLLKAKIK